MRCVGVAAVAAAAAVATLAKCPFVTVSLISMENNAESVVTNEHFTPVFPLAKMSLYNCRTWNWGEHWIWAMF